MPTPVHPLPPAAEGHDVEAGVGPIFEGRSNESRHRPRTRVYLDETLPVFFNKAFPGVDVIVVGSFYLKIARHNKLSGWTAIVYVTSFLLSFCLHLVGLSSSGCIHGQVEWRGGMIAYLSTVLRMLSAATLLLFLDYGVHSVAVLPPFLLALALVAAWSWRTLGTEEAREELGYNWGHFKRDLTLEFDLSANVVSMAFAGLAGRVLGGGYKQLQGRRRGLMAVAPECLLFYGLVLGLFLVLHCTVPSYVMMLRTRRKVAKVYKPILAYLALLLVVLASVVAAEDMLRINVFFVFFGIVAAAFAYFLWRKYDRWGGENAARVADEEEEQRQRLPPPSASATARRERDSNFSQYILKGYFTPLFSLVMVTHSKYSIIDDGGAAGTLSWIFKFFLSLVLCSILIYAVRILVFAEMQDGDRDRCAISCTTYATYGAMAITGVCFVLVMAREFDELKNIIAS
ncbi:hypothetical protein BS78_08G006400 [Paspalum vaginatum]|nr:hypothetical protein BS78_08G006400 [Paspalum vaginatum]